MVVGAIHSTLSLGKPSTWGRDGGNDDRTNTVCFKRYTEAQIKMKDKLVRVATLANNLELKFNALVHHVNNETLRAAFGQLKSNKACGIDGITLDGYGSNLGDNINNLVTRMKEKSYKPQPVKRVFIPKPGSDDKRPLGIPATEDKMVQIAVKEILEPIFEPLFLDCSHGFRPNKSCHTAISALDTAVMTKPVNYIVEVDIKQFFNNISHYWLQRALEERMSDSNMLWLIRSFLKAGVMEDGVFYDSDRGASQGSCLSPLLANIYLHYVLDLWVEKCFKQSTINYVELIRYCDDFVVLFQSEKDAHRFLEDLKERFAKFNLEVSPTKTRVFKFSKQEFARNSKNGVKSNTFDFLGFTHYFHKSRKGFTIFGHKTSKGRLRDKLQKMKEYLRKVRNLLRLKDWIPIIKAKLTGHYNYYGVSGNYRCLRQFYNRTISLLFKWLNRRSQKKSMNWDQYMNYLQIFPLPQPRIVVTLYKLGAWRK